MRGDRLEQDGGNLNGIGVELCVNADGNFEQTMQNGAQLTAYLLRQYGLGVENVRQHYDFSGKNCPQTIREAAGGKNFCNWCEAPWRRNERKIAPNKTCQQIFISICLFAKLYYNL